jgi:hypothetical protein
MASLSRAGSRIGKAKVRFDLKVKVKNMFLPKVANGAKIFVIMERGKTHKSWTKPHGYTTSTQVNANKNYVDEWADECLQVPITLYRSQQGMFDIIILLYVHFGCSSVDMDIPTPQKKQ